MPKMDINKQEAEFLISILKQIQINATDPNAIETIGVTQSVQVKLQKIADFKPLASASRKKVA